MADVNAWMADMTAEGHAPKGVSKPFRLPRQALKRGMAQGLLARNARELRRPPKRARTPISALPREDLSRMLALARQAQPKLLGIATELALTRRTLDMLRLARAGAARIVNELALPFGNPCIPGTQ